LQDINAAPISSGLSLYRFVLSTQQINDSLNELPEPLKIEDGAFTTLLVIRPGVSRSIVMYPCRNGEIINFSATVPNEALKDTPVDSWNADGSIDDMLEIFSDFPAWMKTLMRCVLHFPI
jgi:hypothetical protein